MINWKTRDNLFPPVVTKVNPSGLVLNLKRGADGYPSRFQANHVARGNFQDDRFDLGDLYAPVACIETVCILLSVKSIKRWFVSQLDMKGACL